MLLICCIILIGSLILLWNINALTLVLEWKSYVTGFAKGTFFTQNLTHFLNFVTWIIELIFLQLSMSQATLMGYHLRWREALSVIGVRFYCSLPCKMCGKSTFSQIGSHISSLHHQPKLWLIISCWPCISYMGAHSYIWAFKKHMAFWVIRHGMVMKLWKGKLPTKVNSKTSQGGFESISLKIPVFPKILMTIWAVDPVLS